MRMLLPALCAVAVTSSALAQEAVDPAVVEQVTVIATRGYLTPATAIVTNVHKSLARNGMGYCGEVTIEDGDGITVFHVLLETTGGPSVLRLADFPESDTSANAVAVRQLMKNFGCTD